jgi:hypothetical protein
MPHSDATLIIRHLPGEPPTFEVERLRDGKRSGHPAAVASPAGFPVDGRPDATLLRELAWYLERFLDYPFPPDTERAVYVQAALRAWGEQTFAALFGQRDGGRLFDEATAGDYSRLVLQISSDDPRILAWPWEALRDGEAGGVLAHTCQIERRLNQLRDPAPLSTRLPRDRVNILLVVCRPFAGDVRFRSISRPLVELIEKYDLPAHVDVLRPPTFDQLREHLRTHPNFYHVLHFDGHGAYVGGGGTPAHRYLMQGPEGRLAFEKDDGSPDLIEASRLSALLREHAVPGVVLNACQSAMIDGRADDPFASVAAALLRSGMRSVVAMAYSVYVSAAQQFLPAFYRRLFAAGRMSEAVRAGRQQLHARPERVCARGEFPLDD